MLLDTELFDRIRKEEMKRLGSDLESLRQVMIDNPAKEKAYQRNSLAWLDHWEEHNEEQRLRKEAKERREKWEERQHKRGALHTPRVDVGFQGELNERFKLHCEIPEPLIGCDLEEETFSQPESKYNSLTHYLRAKAKL